MRRGVLTSKGEAGWTRVEGKPKRMEKDWSKGKRRRRETQAGVASRDAAVGHFQERRPLSTSTFECFP